MDRIRTWVLAIVAIVVLIVVLQNTESVETKILFLSLSMPRAVLLFVTLLIGFVLGLLAASWRTRERKAKVES